MTMVVPCGVMVVDNPLAPASVHWPLPGPCSGSGRPVEVDESVQPPIDPTTTILHSYSLSSIHDGCAVLRLVVLVLVVVIVVATRWASGPIPRIMGGDDGHSLVLVVVRKRLAVHSNRRDTRRPAPRRQHYPCDGEGPVCSEIHPPGPTWTAMAIVVDRQEWSETSCCGCCECLGGVTCWEGEQPQRTTTTTTTRGATGKDDDDGGGNEDGSDPGSCDS